MLVFFQKFLGYALIAFGVYFVYIVFFQPEKLPVKYKTWFYKIILIIVCIIAIVIGSLLVI